MELQLREKLRDAARRRETDRLGVEFAFLTEALDLTTPAGRGDGRVTRPSPEFEREILRERVRAARGPSLG